MPKRRYNKINILSLRSISELDLYNIYKEIFNTKNRENSPRNYAVGITDFIRLDGQLLGSGDTEIKVVKSC